VEKYYQARKILARKRLPKGMRKRFRGYERKLQSGLVAKSETTG
jgi:hypothetical protein